MAGTQGVYSLSDIMEKRIFLEVLPGVTLDTGLSLKRKDGKPRLRRIDTTYGEHSYITLSNLLLMPIPIREIGKTPEAHRLQLLDSHFSVSTIDVSISRLERENVTLKPLSLVLKDSMENCATVDYDERLNQVIELWRFSFESKKPFEEQSLIKDHYQAIYQNNLSDLKRVTGKLRKRIHSDEDPLRQLINKLKLGSDIVADLGVTNSVLDVSEDDLRTSLEVKHEVVKKWRKITLRGSQGELFRKSIQSAYSFNCFFSGTHLPSTNLNKTPGVDAAHILPWALTNNNSIRNGLCLNKMCHWAFDSGILRLDFDSRNQQYISSVPDQFLELHQKGGIDLTYFKNIVGVIPVGRLPKSKSDWPSIDYINQFNEIW